MKTVNKTKEYRLGCWLAFALLLVGEAFAQGNAGGSLPMPPKGPAPQVRATDINPGKGPASFSPAIGEEPAPASAQPPLKNIRPMPMPYPPKPGAVATPAKPGVPIWHDLRTKKTVIGPAAKALLPQSPPQRQSGGYYGGADGAPAQDEVHPASFGTKSRITNTADHPWRMNVKVAMRFGANWFVCSGAMRDMRTVQTAGHCVFNFGGTGWADEILVYPGWDGNGDIIPFDPNQQTYGAARGIQLGSWTSWTNNGSFDFDWGVIALDRAVGALTGWYGWEFGSGCPTASYNVGAFPAEGCGTPGLHNGRDMYYWFGTIDSCPNNQLQLNTTPGCFTALWGGESGSNLYRIDNGNRFTRGIASTSDRAFIANYVDTDQAWVEYLNNNFIPTWARGAAFDLQPLDMAADPITIRAGTSTAALNHLGVNGTNGTFNGTFNFDVLLSTNSLISGFDTLLSSQAYSWNYAPVSSVRVNMGQVTIPENTPAGTYWLGVLYNAATDGNSGNNATSDWDAQQITVLTETNPPSPNPMTWASAPAGTSPFQIRMVATTATDPVPPIQYQFNFTSSPTGGTGGASASWQSSSTYINAGLQPNHNYCYQVAARDGNNNATGFSTTNCAYTLANVPGAGAFTEITSNSIKAAWNNNGNPAGTQYFVENITKGTNSGWITATSWNSTSLAPGTSYTFRVKARNNNGIETFWLALGSVSTKPAPKKIVVLSPNGGNVWPVGSTQNIQWSSTGITGNVKIELSRNNGATWSLLATTLNDGAHSWNVTAPVTNTAKIRITSVNFPTVSDTSNAAFKITGRIVVAQPNGGNLWKVGTTQQIRWTSNAVTGNVAIQISRNGGISWTNLLNSTPNDGNQPWVVSGPVTANALIRIMSVTVPTVRDASNAPFRITP